MPVLHRVRKGKTEQSDMFLDLVSHVSQLSPKTQTIAEFEDAISSLRNCGVVEDEITCMEYLARFRCNNYVMFDADLRTYGEGTFPAASLINHSCEPNCVVLYREKTLYLRAICDIAKGEELFIAYVDPVGERPSRRCSLKDKYHFDCLCSRCVGPAFGSSSVELSQEMITSKVMNFYFENYSLPAAKYDAELRELRQSLPTSCFDVKSFTVLADSLQVDLENNDWITASNKTILTIVFYVLQYRPHHCLICLQVFLAAKCYWNTYNAKEAAKFIKLALEVHAVAYGPEFNELKDEMLKLQQFVAREL
jgi:SET domain